MSTDRQLLGQRGEQLVESYLVSKGYQILERRYRYKRAEIDLIAFDTDTLIAVEVKSSRCRAPFSTVPIVLPTASQWLRLRDALAIYAFNHDYQCSMRFDLVEVAFETDDHYQITHYPSAWYPE